MNLDIDRDADVEAYMELKAARNAFDIGYLNENDYSHTIVGGTNLGINNRLKSRLLIERTPVTDPNEHKFGKIPYPTVSDIFNGRQANPNATILFYDPDCPNRTQSASIGGTGVFPSVTPYGYTPDYFPEFDDNQYQLNKKYSGGQVSEQLYPASTAFDGGSGIVNYSLYSLADQPIIKNAGTPYMPYRNPEKILTIQENQAEFATEWYKKRADKNTAIVQNNNKKIATSLGSY